MTDVPLQGATREVPMSRRRPLWLQLRDFENNEADDFWLRSSVYRKWTCGDISLGWVNRRLTSGNGLDRS